MKRTALTDAAPPAAKRPRHDAREDLVFMQLDCDYYVASRNGDGARAVIRLFGSTAEGHAVLLHVRGYLPYFYAAIDGSAAAFTSLDELRARLNAAITARATHGVQGGGGRQILEIGLVERQNVMGFHPPGATSTFYRIVCAVPAAVAHARAVLEDWGAATYESNVPFVLRFMIDRGFGGAQWVRVPAAQYAPVADPARSARPGIFEAECAAPDAVHALPADAEEWSHLAPLRLLSFDIECAGRPGVFPDPALDPVIQIANYLTVQGEQAPRLATVFVLGTCAPIADADVRTFDDERAMLAAWARLVAEETDPDILTGYNINGFDIPYLVDRAKALSVAGFDAISRLVGEPMRVREATFSSNQTGKRVSKEITVAGRLVLDVFQVVQRDYKLSSYTLNSVAAHFLGQQKEDVHHSIISELHAGTDEDRRRLAVYCLKDALLPQRLLDKLMTVVNYCEMARVTGVPCTYLLTRGQGIKVMSHILRQCAREGLIVPAPNTKARRGGEGGDGGDGYEGATVIEPHKGYYDQPVATLDFASLYPSIMMAHNLCYTSLLPDHGPLPPSLGEDDYERTPAGHRFVRAHVRKGLLPRILEQLLQARSRAKKLMEKEEDKMKRMVYNGRQLALKVSANSVYGFTGQSVGQLPCLAISASVTAYGREMIELTKRTVEEEYRVENGYTHDAEVIYGDSVTSDTPVLVRSRPDLVPQYMSMFDLHMHYAYFHDCDDPPADAANKWYQTPDDGLEVWSERGWTRVRRIIAHSTSKRIFRITTPTGIVCVTEDHSLLRPDASVCKPSEVDVGTPLLHHPLPVAPPGPDTTTSRDDAYAEGKRMATDKYDDEERRIVPTYIISAEEHVRRAFWEGYSAHCSDEGGIIVQTQVSAASLYWLLTSLGHAVRVTAINEDAYRVSIGDDAPQRRVIVEIEELPGGRRVVFDLETENHHFSAGIGELVVHNTDSVMVLFGMDTVAEAMERGRAAAKLVTARFPRPISLEFEKVYFPYLLMAKKRYAGLFWTRPEKYDKLDAKWKGIESVRRDNCGLVRTLVATSLRKVLIDRDVRGAVDFAKATIADLLQNKVDLSLLVVTKQLKDNYKNAQPHAVLAEKMRKRDAATAPKIGDRVPYVIVAGDKKSKMYDRAEHPIYVLEHDVPIDARYYVENQLSKPLIRIFGAIMDNPQEILAGDHTRSIVKTLPKSGGGILAFARVRESCLGCRVVLAPGERTLCAHCLKSRGIQLRDKAGETLAANEAEYTRLWTQCQECQGSTEENVICTASDCPIFYARTRAKRDLATARTAAEKFAALRLDDA